MSGVEAGGSFNIAKELTPKQDRQNTQNQNYYAAPL